MHVERHQQGLRTDICAISLSSCVTSIVPIKRQQQRDSTQSSLTTVTVHCTFLWLSYKSISTLCTKLFAPRLMMTPSVAALSGWGPRVYLSSSILLWSSARTHLCYQSRESYGLREKWMEIELVKWRTAHREMEMVWVRSTFVFFQSRYALWTCWHVLFTSFHRFFSSSLL